MAIQREIPWCLLFLIVKCMWTGRELRFKERVLRLAGFIEVGWEEQGGMHNVISPNVLSDRSDSEAYRMMT